MQREAQEGVIAVCAEFSRHVQTVVLHGFGTDVEICGDLLRRLAVGDHQEDAALGGGEVVDARSTIGEAAGPFGTT